MEMKRTSFVCFGTQGSKDSLVYQEIPGRDGGEEFFLFFSPGESSQELFLRNLFREAVSASRLGAPAHYFSQFIDQVRAVTRETGADERALSGALLMIQIRRGEEVYLLCNRDSALFHWDVARACHSRADSMRGFEEVPLGAPCDQRDLFKSDPMDFFVLYRFAMAAGEHTVILVPSGEFIEEHGESLRNGIFSPSFELPQETGIALGVPRSFPALHWSDRDREMPVAKERKALLRRRVPVPVAAGILAGLAALIIFYGPLAKHGARNRDGRAPALLGAVDGRNRDSTMSDRRMTGDAARGYAQTTPLSEAWKRRFSAPVTSSPVAQGGMIFFGCRDGFFYAYRRDGELAWKYRSGAGIGASPCCVGERVIGANYRGDVFCLSAKTGAAVWTHPARSKIVSTPAANGEIVVVGTMDGRLIALRLGDAKRLWEKKLGTAIWASPVVGKDYIIAATTSGSLVKLGADGKILWKVNCGSGIYSSPACLDDSDLVVCGTKGKAVLGYALSTGALRWSCPAGAEVSGSPRCGSDAIFVGTKAGSLLAVGLDGTLLWSKDVGGPIYSKPLLVGQMLIVGTQASTLVALEAESGERLGAFDAGSAIYSSPDNDGELIYVGSYGGIVYAIRLSARAAT
jgi:outer membrane protein assembly factor BamB